MWWGSKIIGLALTVALFVPTSATAGSKLNEVGALLVYPVAVGLQDQETFIHITNVGSEDLTLHISFIDGREGSSADPNPNYCYECDFDLDVTANDTELLSIVKSASGGADIAVQDSLEPGDDDGGPRLSCPHNVGMVVVTIEDSATGQTRSDNVLLGSEVLVDYAQGSAMSIAAIPFQGSTNDGDRRYDFNDVEYGRMPRILATDFIAPDPGTTGPLTGELALFTLGFDRQFPPLVDCSVTGFDAYENPFSASVQFGCWTMISLNDISPEFAWPQLGVDSADPDSHGWLSLNCRVDQDPQLANGFDANGGVHGVIMQRTIPPMPVREPFEAAPTSDTRWGRTLFQSVTTGDSVSLTLEGQPGSLTE